ncbi:Late embryogenesis abundant protein [Sesbania bispinosa]|nr:Late embryogenesis abundant protein [Sesbania bispinosa]
MKVGSGKGRKVCITLTAVVIAIILLIVILALTVFKAKHPVTTVDSVKLEDLHVSLDIAKLRVDLNVTLDVDVSVKNPNKVGFKYSDSTAHLNYRGQLIGEVPLPAGEISSSETKGFNLTLTIMADRLLSNSQVFSDITSGTLPLNTFVRISGKVSIMGFIKVHVVSSSSCDLVINVSNRTVGSQECQYKTKL